MIIFNNAKLILFLNYMNFYKRVTFKIRKLVDVSSKLLKNAEKTLQHNMYFNNLLVKTEIRFSFKRFYNIIISAE